MKNKLKPCPFCKGEAGDHDYGQEYWCKCQSCLAEGPKTSSRDTADFLWNMRPAIADAAPLLFAAAERVLKKLDHPVNCVNDSDAEALRKAIKAATA